MADDTRSLPRLAYVGAGATILVLAGALELAMGRKIWGISGQPGIWSGDINSPHNSQYLPTRIPSATSLTASCFTA